VLRPRGPHIVLYLAPQTYRDALKAAVLMLEFQPKRAQRHYALGALPEPCCRKMSSWALVRNSTSQEGVDSIGFLRALGFKHIALLTSAIETDALLPTAN
jgi:hypothetical protein